MSRSNRFVACSVLIALFPIGVLQPRVRADDAKKSNKPIIRTLGDSRFRQGSGISQIAYSPDGKMIASSGYGSIRLWNAQSGKVVRALESELPVPSSGGFGGSGRESHVRLRVIQACKLYDLICRRVNLCCCQFAELAK